MIQKYNQVDRFYLVPNITSVSMSIEQRGAQLAANIKELALREKIESAHIITHSFAGIDVRAALSLYGIDGNLAQSLSTICTPHLGMRLIDNIGKWPGKYTLESAEKAFEAVGLS